MIKSRRGEDMWHTWEKKNACRVLVGNQKERDH
jgi:hypothetical protein